MTDPIRTALAEQQGEGPSDEELCDLWSWAAAQDHGPWPTQQHCFARAVLARWGHQPTPQPLSPSAQAADDSTLRDAALLALTTLEGWSNYDQWVWPISAMEQVRRGTTEAIAALRMALSRFAPPTEGEVAKLAEWLRENAEDERQMCESSNRASLNLERAAELLQQQHPTPVPVSERLPEPGDCDENGYCWRWNTISDVWSRQHYSRHWYEFETHWLPAHALPLPQGEVG